MRKQNGGQGRNRTADASLFRAALSMTYESSIHKTKDLDVFDLDSIWTPSGKKVLFGLRLDSVVTHRNLE
jgi:hypothetical protein